MSRVRRERNGSEAKPRRSRCCGKTRLVGAARTSTLARPASVVRRAFPADPVRTIASKLLVSGQFHDSRLEVARSGTMKMTISAAEPAAGYLPTARMLSRRAVRRQFYQANIGLHRTATLCPFRCYCPVALLPRDYRRWSHLGSDAPAPFARESCPASWVTLSIRPPSLPTSGRTGCRRPAQNPASEFGCHACRASRPRAAPG